MRAASGPDAWQPPPEHQLSTSLSRAILRLTNDGTISTDGNPIGQIGVFLPDNLGAMSRQDGVLFRTDGDVFPVDTPRVLQGFLEGSNVDPMLQMARLVEIQRGYELGQSFLEAEDQRIRSAIKALIR